MRFEKILPSPPLRPYIKYLAISENPEAQTYKVFPSTGLVLGFQYGGRLSALQDNRETRLQPSGITGISDHVKVFRNSLNTGTILVFFTEVGITCFSDCPAHELFNQSVSLDNLFHPDRVSETEEKLALAASDNARVKIVERFLLSELKDRKTDKLIVEAVRLIYEANGSVRIKELNEKLAISQSPFEKRFRKVVGTTPKKFASIVRFNAVLKNLDTRKSLIEICYAYNFFDQAHFIKDFKQYTGDTPENFRRFLGKRP